MKNEFWNKERKQHYLKLVAKEVKRAIYIKSYMARKRAEGKIKHWRQYKLEKATNDTEQNK